jgi:geranylgeranyl diphosphate synthase type II
MSSPIEPSSDIERLIQPVRDVEAHLLAFLRERPMPRNLRDAIEYALLGGGKRMRPVIVLHACTAVGGRLDQAYAPAGAIELIHAFSLVHDDLPAMDDDDMRRGRPTLHRHASEAMAILAGDAMMALAVEMLGKRVQPESLACRLIHELVVATNDMICGQVLDTLPDFAPDDDPLHRLQTIHRHKTGALLRCSARMGALCGSATDGQLAMVSRYADAIGLMFQIVDDLLDVTATAAELGKATGKDADKGKLTYPGLLGVDASRREVQRLRDEAHDIIAPLGPPADALRQLCDFLATRRT